MRTLRTILVPQLRFGTPLHRHHKVLPYLHRHPHPSDGPCDMRADTDWRNETAADVGWGNYEQQEERDARRSTPTGPCYLHHFQPCNGGGTCRCGETVGAEEL